VEVAAQVVRVGVPAERVAQVVEQGVLESLA
jgi:hypothetical protein